jgi:uncharacterized protein (DUF4415 family)
MSAKRTVSYTRDTLPEDETVWERVDRLTDEEITEAVASDPDVAPIADEAWFASAELVMPEPKRPVTLRLDRDVLDWFKAQGPGYQTRINAVLRAYMAAHRRTG